MNIGVGSYRVRVRFGEKIDELHNPPPYSEITLEVHVDDNQPKLRDHFTCQQKKNLAKINIQLEIPTSSA